MTTLCRVLQVNRSTYYKFRNRKDSRRTVENRELRAKILALYIKSDKRFGSQKKQFKQRSRIWLGYGILLTSEYHKRSKGMTSKEIVEKYHVTKQSAAYRVKQDKKKK